MKIASISAAEKGGTDRFLYRLAARLQHAGCRTAGLVQINTPRPDAYPWDMDVKVLPDGPTLRISQSLGSGSRGCRLDPERLETAVGLVESTLDSTYDCLLVNKFGKQEAQGGGLCRAIAEAASLGLPVVVGVSALNEDALETFIEGTHTRLPHELDAVQAWLVQKK